MAAAAREAQDIATQLAIASGGKSLTRDVDCRPLQGARKKGVATAHPCRHLPQNVIKTAFKPKSTSELNGIAGGWVFPQSLGFAQMLAISSSSADVRVPQVCEVESLDFATSEKFSPSIFNAI
ncbi:MAG: hypothetical protein KGQ46_12275 [Hyphomicrobiales bacterium]|nr:hypothetical protein [Hyphomicrobiales bacterium]MDE2113864.1 hypothetical protein [Hyphomicrobiales bacterium]